MVSNPEFEQANSDEQKTFIGDLIYQFVAQMSSDTEAPKITGMIIDLDKEDLLPAVSSAQSLFDKVKEGQELLGQDGQ